MAAFCVLIVHYNGWFVGGVPEQIDLTEVSAFRLTQSVIASATCICVNMFLIISGYFGIRLRWESVVKICLLLLMIYVPCYIARGFFDHTFDGWGLAKQFLVFTRAGYFIQCYMMLMFLSPVLNAAVEKYGRKILPWTIAFLVIEFWFDCITKVDNLSFNSGYSVIHFVLMYMIARVCFLYKEEIIKVDRKLWVVDYVVLTSLIWLLYIIRVKWWNWYSNPIVVLSSVCTFLPFIYSHSYNKTINWLAQGVLAVYIIQVAQPFHAALVKIDNYTLVSYSYPLYLACMLGVIVDFSSLAQSMETSVCLS